MMYECSNCGYRFEEEEAEFKEVDIESECGVGHQFGDHHKGYQMICPDCGSDNVSEIYDREEFTAYEYNLVRVAISEKLTSLKKANEISTRPDLVKQIEEYEGLLLRL